MPTVVSFTSLHNRRDWAAGAALKLRAMSHSCYVIRCVRPGRVLGQTCKLRLIFCFHPLRPSDYVYDGYNDLLAALDLSHWKPTYNLNKWSFSDSFIMQLHLNQLKMQNTLGSRACQVQMTYSLQSYFSSANNFSFSFYIILGENFLFLYSFSFFQ